MFHSSSSSSYSDAAFLSSALFSATAPDSLPYDANGCLPPFLSSSPPYPPFLSSSPPYAAAYQLHRSRSTHSLPLYHHIPNSLKAPPPPPPLLLSSPPSLSSCDYLDLHAGPLRRVLSTGDLKGMNALCDNYSQDGASVTAKVGRYSAEERKERIERYRSKRNQRNFHKKITYACRKTLADSRPRVRGRFARNGEMEAETETEIEMAAAAISVSYNNYEDKQSCGDGRGDNGGDLWSHVQAAMVEADDGECCYYEDVLAIFADDFSMNPLSCSPET